MDIGIVGAGRMGGYHARAYNKIAKDLRNDPGNIQLVGVADVNRKSANEVADEYGIRACLDYMDLFDGGVDAISVCVPTSMHKKVVIDAINKHIQWILVEKPISDNLKDATEMVSLAKKMGCTLLVGHVERFNPSVIGLKKIIDSGELGHVVSASAKRVGPLPPRIKDVGVIIDLAVHDIDIISYLYGSYPTDVYAIDGNIMGMAGDRPGNIGVEDRASIMMKYSDGRVGVIETNWLTPHMIRKLDIVGFEKVAYLDYTGQMISIHGKDAVEEIKFTKEEPLMKELMHFIDVVKSNGAKKPLVTGEEGIEALKVALAAIESHKTGNVVRLGTMQ